jgi:formate hydrogenlyase subunit 3/multisubunit Na+/H+ antiporter MnhD subunit
VGVAACWIILGAVSLLESERVRFINRFVFPAGAAGAFVLAAIGMYAVGEPAQTLELPLGLPDLPFHLRLDPLAAFFLLLLGVGAFGVCVYAAGYFDGESPQRLRLLSLQYHMFLASMAFVILADDAYLFMVAWESMAVSSYFLVTTDHRQAAIRSAGFLYLLIAHVGALAILLCFGILHGGGAMADYSFDSLRAHGLQTSVWSSVAFALAFVGFGAKAA